MILSFDNDSFKRLMFAESLFMAGYIVIKVGLSLLLKENGFSLMYAYSVSTTASALFYISNLLLGVISPKLGSHKKLMLFGVILSCLGFSLFSMFNKKLVIIALTFFIVGAALYCINLNLFINKHYSESNKRHQANNIYQVMLNLGALIGLIILISGIYCHSALILIAGTLCLILNLLSLSSRKIVDIHSNDTSNWNVFVKYSFIIFFLLFCYLLMQFRDYTRYFILGLFIVCVCLVLKDSFSTKNSKYLKFSLLLFLCCFPYWLAIAIYYNQFSIFLNNHVNETIFGIYFPPLIALMVDPIVNMLFGTGIIKLFSRRELNTSYMLVFGLVAIFIAFFILGNIHYLYSESERIPVYWVFISISFIAVGEFLIFPTLQSQVSDIAKSSSKQGFYMGLIQFVSSVAAVCAYYLIKFSHTNTLSNSLILSDSYKLYTYVYIIFGISIIIFIILSRFGWLVNNVKNK